MRVIWQKVTRLLDLIFCNTENDVAIGYDERRGLGTVAEARENRGRVPLYHAAD